MPILRDPHNETPPWELVGRGVFVFVVSFFFSFFPGWRPPVGILFPCHTPSFRSRTTLRHCLSLLLFVSASRVHAKRISFWWTARDAGAHFFFSQPVPPFKPRIYFISKGRVHPLGKLCFGFCTLGPSWAVNSLSLFAHERLLWRSTKYPLSYLLSPFPRRDA